ncbi:MAG: hypothetical protein H7Z16_13795 [Pyrinomonadaceae bacterium]|nr:hypothetical protein [Pyrinomonadaceae bacterium]
MIPHRMPSHEIFGNGVKQRVTACRKRLRINRNLHKVHFSDEPLPFASETASFSDEYPGVRESSPGRRDASEFREREASPRLEQKVGIT